MQNKHIELKEIIYEITGACKNCCEYCGSKECWNEDINEEKIKQIVDHIAEYPPKAIDISGGDPLLVSKETHAYIVKTLHDVDVEVKILFNPKSLKEDAYEKYGILWFYNWVGVSVNTEEELKILSEHWVRLPTDKITIVTNFNLKNIFFFEKIKNFIKLNNLAWQIQYTMYHENDPQYHLAIYKDDNACNHLFKQMTDAINEGIKIIPADDMNNGPCGAGSCSIGLTSNGDVVPCLSMRSWVDDLTNVIQGNILETALGFIWEHEFNQYRFKCFECCKDKCNKPFILEAPTRPPIILVDEKENYKPTPNNLLYGITPRPPFQPIAMYAVITDWSKPEEEGVVWTTTSSTHPSKCVRYGIFRDKPKKV